MESLPSQEGTQLRFKESPESIKAGSILRYSAEDGGHFINQFGFRLDTLPEGTTISTKGFVMAMGVAMPESEGEVVLKDGKTFFMRKSEFPGSSHREQSKFFDGDVIEIVSLPDKASI